MYFDYLKIKIGKHAGLLLFAFIVIALIAVMGVIAPLYKKSGISIELLFVVIICIGIFLPILYIINRYFVKKYQIAKTLSKRIFSEYKHPFKRKWCCEVIAIDLVAQMRVPFLITESTAEKVLCHFLLFIFTGKNQNNKAENAFLNLLALLELNKALIMKSQVDMNRYTKGWSPIRFQFAMASMTNNGQVGPHEKILFNISYISVLMQAIAYLNTGNFESFDEGQLEKFFDEWDRDVWDKAAWPSVHIWNSLPESLNNREFAMENYSDEGFKELAFAFAEYGSSGFPRKDKVSIIGRRLIEKRGNVIPEDDETKEDE